MRLAAVHMLSVQLLLTHTAAVLCAAGHVPGAPGPGGGWRHCVAAPRQAQPARCGCALQLPAAAGHTHLPHLDLLLPIWHHCAVPGGDSLVLSLPVHLPGPAVALPPPDLRLHPCNLLPPADEPRSQESYYSSVNVLQLVGAAYQAAEQAWLPVRRKLREGSVVHVYLPDSSLRLQGGLWVSVRGRQGGRWTVGGGQWQGEWWVSARLASMAGRRCWGLARMPV